jgi:hypothetical protein
MLLHEAVGAKRYFVMKRKLAKKGYEHFVKERTGQGHVKAFYELKDQRLLGEDAFVEKIEKTLTKKREKKYLITFA